MVAKLYSYEFKTRAPKWPTRKGLILQYKDGWGEIAPLPGFSRESLDKAKEEIVSLLHDLPNAKPKLPSVQFGLATALRPFSQAPLKIPFALLNEPRPGFSTMKVKVGHLSIEDAVKHVKTLIGSYRIRLDCNRAWSLEEALLFASHFNRKDFDYLEEPVQTASELVRFSELTGFPIAVDESQNYELPTIKAVCFKPTIVGSLPKLNVPTVLSSAFESSLGLLQIARLHKVGEPPAGLDTFRFFEDDLLVPPLKAEDGFLTWEGSNQCPINMSKLCAL